MALEPIFKRIKMELQVLAFNSRFKLSFREVKEEVKKTAEEMAEDQRLQEEAAAKAQKAKAKAGGGGAGRHTQNLRRLPRVLARVPAIK